jgi:hypothetical protein
MLLIIILMKRISESVKLTSQILSFQEYHIIQQEFCFEIPLTTPGFWKGTERVCLRSNKEKWLLWIVGYAHTVCFVGRIVSWLKSYTLCKSGGLISLWSQ